MSLGAIGGRQPNCFRLALELGALVFTAGMIVIMCRSVGHTPRTITENLVDMTSGWPQVHLLVVTANGFNLPRVWTDWYIAARLQLDRMNIEKFDSTAEEHAYQTNSPTEICRYPSKLIKFHVAVDKAPRDKRLPCWLANIVHKSTSARHGVIDVVVKQLLEIAIKGASITSHFVILSESSIPVKTFVEILKDLVADDRSRFSIWSSAFGSCFPKASAWYSLSSQHAVALLKHPELWVNKDWKVHYASKSWGMYRKSASEDEFYPFSALWKLDLVKSTGQTEFLAWDGTVPTSRKQEFLAANELRSLCQNESIYPSSIKITMQRNPDFRSQHMAFWYGLPHNTSAQFLGDGVASDYRPLRFRQINSGFLIYLKNQAGVWFARKFDSESYVTNCFINQKWFYDHWVGNSSNYSKIAETSCALPDFLRDLLYNSLTN